MTDNERKELLLKAKPILFNTEMVRAILNGRKTQTRQVVKFPAGYNPQWSGYIPYGTILYGSLNIPAVKSPWLTDDIMYVRETWAKMDCNECSEDSCYCESAVERDRLTVFCDGEMYVYKATDLLPDGIKWHPSIHMPKEAARIFLRVTNVRVERLQDMTEEDAYKEGWSKPWCYHKVFENYPDSPIPCEAAGSPNCPADPPCNQSVPELFGSDIWDKTIKKSDLDKYGWAANPWVWVIEFDACIK